MPEKLPTPDKIKEEKERIKEEVEKFKERTEGLNPEIFGVPGEEGLEEEKEEIPKEMLFAYELEEKIAEYTEKARLVKDDILKEIESYLDINRAAQKITWYAVRNLSALINSPLWLEISKGKQEELIRKSHSIKNKALGEIELDLEKNQTNQENPSNIWNTIIGTSSLINSPLWSEINKEKRDELIKKMRLMKDAALKMVESDLEKSETNQGYAWIAIRGLSALINSPLWSEIDKEKQEKLIKKAELAKDNVLEKIELDFDESQIHQNAGNIILGLSALTTLKNYLLKVANQKLKEQEHQKALHPEKEIPPRPEFSSF